MRRAIIERWVLCAWLSAAGACGDSQQADSSDPSTPSDANVDTPSTPDAGVDPKADADVEVGPHVDASAPSPSAMYEHCDALLDDVRAHALQLIDASPTGSPFPQEPFCSPISCWPSSKPEFAYAEPTWPRLGGDTGYGGRVAVSGDTIYGMQAGFLFAAELGAEERIERTDIEVGWQIFVAGDRLMYFDRTTPNALVELDISEPLAPRVVRKREITGQVVDAKLIAGVLRIAVYHRPEAIGWMSAGDPGTQGSVPSEDQAAIDAARVHNRTAVMNSSAEAWLPSFTDIGSAGERGAPQPFFACTDMRRHQGTGASTLSFIEIDVAAGIDSWRGTGLFTEAPAIHSIGDQLIVLAHPWQQLTSMWLSAGVPADATTWIYALDASGSSLRWVGAAIEVAGTISSITPAPAGELHALATSGPVSNVDARDAVLRSLIAISIGTDAITARQSTTFGAMGVRTLVRAGNAVFVPSSINEQPAYSFDVSDPAVAAQGPEVDMLGPWVTLVPQGGVSAIAIGRAVNSAWEYEQAESYLALLDEAGVRERLDLGAFQDSANNPIALDPERGRLIACGGGLSSIGGVACLAFEVEQATVSRLGTIVHQDAPGAGGAGASFGPAKIFGVTLLDDKVVTLSHDQLVVSSWPALEVLQEHTWPR